MPSLARSAGAIFIMTCLGGKENPEFVMALRTRSRASPTALLARPTIEKAGRPFLISHSISTTRPS